MPANAGISPDGNTIIVITEQHNLLVHNAQWMSADQQKHRILGEYIKNITKVFFCLLSFGLHIPK